MGLEAVLKVISQLSSPLAQVLATNDDFRERWRKVCYLSNNEDTPLLLLVSSKEERDEAVRVLEQEGVEARKYEELILEEEEDSENSLVVDSESVLFNPFLDIEDIGQLLREEEEEDVKIDEQEIEEGSEMIPSSYQEPSFLVNNETKS